MAVVHRIPRFGRQYGDGRRPGISQTAAAVAEMKTGSEATAITVAGGDGRERRIFLYSTKLSKEMRGHRDPFIKAFNLTQEDFLLSNPASHTSNSKVKQRLLVIQSCKP
ncbi:P-loop containing nucleoside triphosphatehydrolases superfamily protein [Striga asiatica]|uniref:P-loop containing nucleoside triphosphatehydrolases superfamily protein n=1 Tax=Striga asiatica TaxID=4170 RepID=A0A5A7PC25_STRAF|nr:P-loop containing nucleoside triphosphatehydrolases superfamily protein [Striga asiatica]